MKKKSKQEFIEYLESCKEHSAKLKDKERGSQQFTKTVDVDKKTGDVIHPKKSSLEGRSIYVRKKDI